MTNFAIFLAGIFVAAFGLTLQRALYEQLIRSIEQERDRARSEAKVYLGLLCPATRKSEANLGGAAGPAAEPWGENCPAGPNASPKPASSRGRRRVPFRQLFNEVRKLSNLPQQKTDALAKALSQQKISVQEKSHA